MMNFGADRVLEPLGVTPISAWKLDNSAEIGKNEIRISIDYVHLEGDSFQQICNSCGFDEDRIKAKIYDLIDKRGKIHNPFTGTGGLVMGRVDKIGEDLIVKTNLKKGDKICCISSLTGLPIHIDKIVSVDYNYGQLKCSGYAIMFETTPYTFVDESLKHNYIMSAIDEAGSLFAINEIAKNINTKKCVLIGRDPDTMILYAQSIREGTKNELKAIAIMDKENKRSIPHEQLRNIMKPEVEETYFVDLTKPLEVYEQLRSVLQDDMGEFDQVIVSEDIVGAETLGVLIVKEGGIVYFTDVVNNYAIGAMVAEAMNKFITTYSFDQYVAKYPEFTLELLRKCKEKEDAIFDMYEAAERRRRLTRNQEKSRKAREHGKVGNFIYQSMVTKSMVEEVLNIAKYDCNVIIQGETGVGKEQILSIIHQNSDRKSKPCIKINCATITESLAESEFFGYEAGAFTGAGSGGKQGYFELANNGILFLDEIGTLSMNMQSKLLRVLQENQFYRVGGTKQVSVNVRVIVANNVPVKQLVDEGKFREDLYYRLNICTIDVPPLRDRKADIICLAEAFMQNWSKKYGVQRELSTEAINALSNYYWPGNVRELENVIHRLVIGSKSIVVKGEDVRELLNEQAYGDMVTTLKKEVKHLESLDFHQLMDQQEKQIIEYALKKEGTTRRAAELLGLPQTTLARKKLKHGL